MQSMVRKWILVWIVAAMPALHALAQDGSNAGGARQGRGGQFGGQFAGMQRINGEVTAVSGTTLSVKTLEGATLQVTTTENTRAMKAKLDGSGQPSPIKVADIRVGDGVMAAGNLDAPSRTLHAAAILVATDAAQVKALKENLGKTYIVGKVTAIDLDNAKMTVLRSDGVSQTIGFDETTSFRRGRAGMNFGIGGGGQMGAGRQGTPASGAAESITLADIKVGDEVGGRGALKDGVFVPAELTVGTPGQRRQRPATPNAATPPIATTPPQ